MKKIILLFILVFSFSFNATAQTKKVNTKTETKSKTNIFNDVEEFATITKITAEQKNNLHNLIKMRDADVLKGKTVEAKKAIFDLYMTSFFASITPEQKELLTNSNLELAKRLTTFSE